jgi:hypothetical protein
MVIFKQAGEHSQMAFVQGFGDGLARSPPTTA